MGDRYFSYDPGDGYETHATEDEARRRCEEAIGFYADEASDGGWSEEVEGVAWGRIHEVATKKVIPVPEDYVHEFDEWWDFELKPIQSQEIREWEAVVDDSVREAVEAAREEEWEKAICAYDRKLADGIAAVYEHERHEAAKLKAKYEEAERCATVEQVEKTKWRFKYDEMRAEAARLREALEFYADEYLYRPGCIVDGVLDGRVPIVLEGGQKARETLAGEEK